MQFAPTMIGWTIGAAIAYAMGIGDFGHWFWGMSGIFVAQMTVWTTQRP